MDVGFVYIWYDRYRKMLYIGSHIGTIDDGYLGSSKRLKRAYARRPSDFMRRIVFYFTGDDRTKLYEIEQQWLDLIPEHELGKRFYNLKKKANGGSQRGHSKSKRMREKLSQYRLGKRWSEESRKRMSDSHQASGYRHSEETKTKMKEAQASQEMRARQKKNGLLGAMRRWHKDKL